MAQTPSPVVHRLGHRATGRSRGHRASDAVPRLAATQATASAWLLSFIIVLTGADLGLKAVGLRGVLGLFELTELAVPAVAFLGVAHAHMTGGHIRVDLVTRRLRGGRRAVVELVARGVEIAFLVALVAASWVAVERSFTGGELRFGVVSLEVWPSRAVVLAGALAWLVAAVAELGRARDR